MSAVLKYAKSVVALLLSLATAAVTYFPGDSNVKLYGGAALAVLTAVAVALVKNSVANDVAVVEAVEHTGFIPAKYDALIDRLIAVLEAHQPTKPAAPTVTIGHEVGSGSFAWPSSAAGAKSFVLYDQSKMGIGEYGKVYTSAGGPVGQSHPVQPEPVPAPEPAPVVAAPEPVVVADPPAPPVAPSAPPSALDEALAILNAPTAG